MHVKNIYILLEGVFLNNRLAMLLTNWYYKN